MVNKQTKSMMSMLPQWMKMAKDEQSVGAKFIDAFGVEIGEIERYIEEAWQNMHIGSANLQTADYCYKIPLSSRDVIDSANTGLHVRLVIAGVRLDCMPSNTLRLFFENDENTYMIDSDEGYVYIKADEYFIKDNVFKPFDAIEVGGALHYDYMLHHIWNVFDEFGMLLNISRLPGERNETFKNRILDVFKNPGGASEKGIKSGLSRELGIEESDISIGSLADPVYVKTELMNVDGTPTEKYIEFVNQINSNLGFSWGHMNWGEAYWRSVEENNMGFHYLPHIWDGFSAQWADSEVQSGIGAGDDLLVTAPKEEKAIREFKAYVGLHGTEEREEELHPELRFKYSITAEGLIPNEEFTREEYKQTVIASEVIPLHYVLVAMRDFLFKTSVTWDQRYGYVFENKLTPGMDIITGEDVLHNKEEAHVSVHVEFDTANRTVTPKLQELIVDWVDTNNVDRSFTLSTNEHFTQNTLEAKTTMVDVEAVNGDVQLIQGSFAAVVDTEGSFLRGERGINVIVLKRGAMSLELPQEGFDVIPPTGPGTET